MEHLKVFKCCFYNTRYTWNVGMTAFVSYSVQCVLGDNEIFIYLVAEANFMKLWKLCNGVKTVVLQYIVSQVFIAK
jgi:hypothetical protein